MILLKQAVLKDVRNYGMNNCKQLNIINDMNKNDSDLVELQEIVDLLQELLEDLLNI